MRQLPALIFFRVVIIAEFIIAHFIIPVLHIFADIDIFIFIFTAVHFIVFLLLTEFIFQVIRIFIMPFFIQLQGRVFFQFFFDPGFQVGRRYLQQLH